MVMVSMLIMSIPDVEILGVGNLRGQSMGSGRMLYHRVGRYGLPIRLFRVQTSVRYGVRYGLGLL